MNAKTEFKFSDENMIKAHEILKKYPKGKERSAVMPLLYLAQEQNDNWIPTTAMDYVADLLSIPPMQVYEVANFYTMYNKKPVGKYLIQICRTTPCWLCGSNNIVKTCKKELGIDIGETTEDKLFTLIEVECLGACTAAPMMQINDDYYENLTEEKVVEILNKLKGND
jgi:NADH-quinone oxidoreductase subunit E